jgi:hypothetical protein
MPVESPAFRGASASALGPAPSSLRRPRPCAARVSRAQGVTCARGDLG